MLTTIIGIAYLTNMHNTVRKAEIKKEAATLTRVGANGSLMASVEKAWTEDDADQLRYLADMVAQGVDKAACLAYANTFETAVREEISSVVWVWLGGNLI